MLASSHHAPKKSALFLEKKLEEKTAPGAPLSLTILESLSLTLPEPELLVSSQAMARTSRVSEANCFSNLKKSLNGSFEPHEFGARRVFLRSKNSQLDRACFGLAPDSFAVAYESRLDKKRQSLTTPDFN